MEATGIEPPSPSQKGGRTVARAKEPLGCPSVSKSRLTGLAFGRRWKLHVEQLIQQVWKGGRKLAGSRQRDCWQAAHDIFSLARSKGHVAFHFPALLVSPPGQVPDSTGPIIERGVQVDVEAEQGRITLCERTHRD
jgi:hypothetical protein